MRFSISTKGFTDIIDITDQISEILKKSKVKDGVCLIFCPGSTCGLTTIEYESGLIKDLKRALEIVAPMSDNYEHCKRWGDCNGFSHIRSALLKPFLAVPIEDGKLVLGTWQNLVFLDFDNRPRNREIIVKVIKSSSD
ncbi:secondary thiamine-phosphate synthase enzyme YjbQ [Patescibacteria group bacterium]|nr:secondary thiamine-phosphate synthase enzyme YjbQ [Patescibacteria group bacterium]